MSWLKFDEFILLDKQLDNWLANKSISSYEVSPRWLIVIMTSTSDKYIIFFYIYFFYNKKFNKQLKKI